MRRHADGKFRNSRMPRKVSEAVLRARWVEAETLRLKQSGFSFEEVAARITAVGRGQTSATVAMSERIAFPPGYMISRQACHKAFRKALGREASLEVEELRKIDNERTEVMFRNLQPEIERGDLHAIETGIKVLNHQAKINGYAAPERHELTGKDGRPLTLVQLLEAAGLSEDEEQ